MRDKRVQALKVTHFPADLCEGVLTTGEGEFVLE